MAGGRRGLPGGWEAASTERPHPPTPVRPAAPVPARRAALAGQHHARAPALPAAERQGEAAHACGPRTARLGGGLRSVSQQWRSGSRPHVWRTASLGTQAPAGLPLSVGASASTQATQLPFCGFYI